MAADLDRPLLGGEEAGVHISSCLIARGNVGLSPSHFATASATAHARFSPLSQAVLVHARAEGRPGAVPTYSKLLDIIPEHVEKFRMADPDECVPVQSAAVSPAFRDPSLLCIAGSGVTVGWASWARVASCTSYKHKKAPVWRWCSAFCTEWQRTSPLRWGSVQRRRCLARCSGPMLQSCSSTWWVRPAQACSSTGCTRAPAFPPAQVFYNSNKHVDKFGTVRAKLAHVKELAVENVEKALARGERIQLLVDKSEDLRTSSTVFEKKSKEVRDVFWWRNARVWAMLAGVVLLAALVATGFACKWRFATCF